MISNSSRTAPIEIPLLPPFDPDAALTLQAACKLRLVPGHDGRRLCEDELRIWASTGRQLSKRGPLYLFPSLTIGNWCVTTPAWCAAWVEFVCSQQSGIARPNDRIRSGSIEFRKSRFQSRQLNIEV